MQGIRNIFLLAFIWLLLGLVTYGIGLLLLPIYCLLTFRGGDDRAEKANQKLSGTLMDHETLIASGLQHRMFALFHRRQLLAITNSRVIVLSRSLFGGFTMRDFQWKDLHDARLSENVLSSVCGSRLSFSLAGSVPALAVDGLASDTATKMYSRAQSEEQAWEEKRRIRLLEDRRASSGGITMGAGLGGASPGATSVLEDLEKAKKLVDSGAVSDAEYQEIKAKILARH